MCSIGENGAGKSTMISIIAGAERPTSGEIRFKGEPVALRSVQDARIRAFPPCSRSSLWCRN